MMMCIGNRAKHTKIAMPRHSLIYVHYFSIFTLELLEIYVVLIDLVQPLYVIMPNELESIHMDLCLIQNGEGAGPLAPYICRSAGLLVAPHARF